MHIEATHVTVASFERKQNHIYFMFRAKRSVNTFRSSYCAYVDLLISMRMFGYMCVCVCVFVYLSVSLNI